MGPHSSFRCGLVVATLAGCNALTGVGSLDVSPEDAIPLPDDDRGRSDADAAPDPTIGGEAGADAGPSSDAATFCPSFAVFCDDLESGELDKWTSLLETNGGKVTVVDAPVFAGKKAMRAVAGPSTSVNGSVPSVAAAARVTIPVVTSGQIAVHARVFMPKTLTEETTIIKVIAKNGVDDMNLKVGTNGTLKIDGDTPDAGAEKTSMKGPTPGSWACIEWQTLVGAAGHQRLVLDGEAIVDAAENTSTSMGFDVVQVGFAASNGAITQEVLFDDVVIATQPIGCP